MPSAETRSPSPRAPVFVTGATGYIGGRLVPRLLEAGYRVRCLGRNLEKLRARPWADDGNVELVEGDVGDERSLARQMQGADVAYYLVHSMLVAGDAYSERDRELAESFARACEAAGVRRILYLGGLGETGEDLSRHLSSRREVEEALASRSVPVTVLRAAMIIGSGSASFEILRYLVERLPVMITPRWVTTESQPIGVRNVLSYLVACLEEPRTVGATLDVGGAEIVSYRELMRIMAEELGLGPRWILPVPVLTPRLSSWWIHLVTPLSHRIARPLAEGLRNRVVARDTRAAEWMPQRLLSPREAISAALGRIREGEVETHWGDAGVLPGDPDWAGGTTFVDRREAIVAARPSRVFRAICRIGGGNGWYAADVLWRIRGWMDRLVGGPGLRRGRRDPERIAYGDALDFWRVTGLQRDRRLELRAEMKLPGIASLEFEILPAAAGSTTFDESREAARCLLVQTARFRPLGLAGLLYWGAVLPLHGIVFQGMLAGIRRTAEGFEAEAERAESVERDETLLEGTRS